MLSFIIPVHNEQQNLRPLHADLTKALGGHPGPREIIFVDDGSSDQSLSTLKDLQREDALVRVVALPEHRGQSAALWAGIESATGDVLVSLDGDRQYECQDIPRLVAALNGVDMVCAWRRYRADGWYRALSSRIANSARRFILRDSIRDSGCTLRVWKREAMKGMVRFDGFHRFMPVLLQLNGKRVKQIPVAHRPRAAGRSHYGTLGRAVRGLRDIIGVKWLHRRRVLVAREEN
jgi:dolichol-phosphate mannosyltransferase